MAGTETEAPNIVPAAKREEILKRRGITGLADWVFRIYPVGLALVFQI